MADLNSQIKTLENQLAQLKKAQKGELSALETKLIRDLSTDKQLILKDAQAQHEEALKNLEIKCAKYKIEINEYIGNVKKLKNELYSCESERNLSDEDRAFQSCVPGMSTVLCVCVCVDFVSINSFVSYFLFLLYPMF